MSMFSSDVSDGRATVVPPRDAELINKVVLKERRERRTLRFMRLSGLLLTLLIWEGLVVSGFARELLVGQPTRIAMFLFETVSGGEILIHTLVTGFETILGYSLGIAIGCTTGFAMWWLPRLGKTVDPYMIGINSIPMVAMAPLFLVWLGLGILTKVALSFTTVFLVMHLTTYSSLRQVEPDMVGLATSFGASRLQIFLKVVVPSTLPLILSSMKVCIGFALTGAVVGEYVAANKGLGYLTLYAAQLYEMSLVWAAIFMLLLMSMFLYASISWLQRRLIPWPGK